MHENTEKTLTRDVTAIRIPSGESFTLAPPNPTGPKSITPRCTAAPTTLQASFASGSVVRGLVATSTRRSSALYRRAMTSTETRDPTFTIGSPSRQQRFIS